MPGPMHYGSVEHLSLRAVQSRDVTQHFFVAELLLQNSPQFLQAMRLSVFPNSVRDGHMEKEVSDPFGLEEREFLIRVPDISKPCLIPLNQLFATLLAFALWELGFDLYGIKAMKSFVAIGSSAANAKRLGFDTLQFLDAIFT